MSFDNKITANERLKNFKKQIERDLVDIKSEYSRIDTKTSKPDYAFLYWVLLKIFNIDEESVSDYITEYNDKSIDLYVHFEETKELFIVQCKYYNEDTRVIRDAVSDFLITPLAILNRGEYKRSKELQKIFNKAIQDPEYRINLQFYTSNTNFSDDIISIIRDFNQKKTKEKSNIHADFFELKDIYEKYYGESYKPTKTLTFPLKTINKGTFASIKEEYGIDYKYQGYYIITPVLQIYELIKASKDKGYQLFEENIREYLGEGGSINRAIGDTLRSETERANFLYYNNGLTMVVKSAEIKSPIGGYRPINLKDPQIVNGCQTVNTIYFVLDNYTVSERLENFKNVFVMTKLLIVPTDEEKDIKFYRDVVKYTNKQNPIPDKVFTASNESVFTRIQTELKRYGLWIRVKQSDKIKFDNEFTPLEKADMLDRAKKIANLFDLDINKKDLCVDLEKILQIALAYLTDGHIAFTKKGHVLKANTEIFKKYSINIQDYLSYENIARLYFLFKKAEFDRNKSEDKRTPIPYYVLGFLSYHILNRDDSSNYNKLLDKVFEKKEQLQSIYQYLANLSKLYRNAMDKDYNVLIKTKIDINVLKTAIDTAKIFSPKQYELLTN